MERFMPIVTENTLRYHKQGQEQTMPIDTEGWYVWLQTASAFSFRASSGQFTARRERAGNGRGDWYWKAYWRCEGKRCSAYLGKSERLSLARLQAVAARTTLSQAGDTPTSDHPLAGHREASVEQRALQAGRASTHLSSRLPIPLTSFLGRDREVEEVCSLLSHPDVRLLTLTGTGGVGKTRLALHVATQIQQIFRNGVHFVELSMIREPGLVVSALAHALHLHEIRGFQQWEQVQEVLADQHTLLVLDNFEHIVQAAPLLEDLLVACPSLTLLVTSRDVLHLRAEQQFPVAPFPKPEYSQLTSVEDLTHNPAVALFLERARAIVPTFQLTTSNACAVVDICIALDGLPLALELAAARIKILSPQALQARLSQRLHLLIGGPSTQPVRQQTLRNTLNWSYSLLSTPEQWLYRLLSVFVGGCTLEALEALTFTLTGKTTSLLDTVTALVDKSLLVSVEQQGEEPRFGMLETVREYGFACLCEQGEREICQQSHATYYLQLAEQGDAHLKGRGQQALWLKRLNEEQANMRAAFFWLLEQRDAQSLLRLSGALWWYWVLRGSRSEALEWLQTALRLPGAEAPTAARAKALCGVGFLTIYLHNRGQEGLSFLQESLALYQELGEQHGLAETFGWFAQAQIYLKDYDAARQLAQQGLALSQALFEQPYIALNSSMLALVIEREGDEARAAASWEHALAQAHEIDEEAGLGTRARRHLARLSLAHGDYTRAKVLVEENLAFARASGNVVVLYWSLAGLADLALLQEDMAQASAFCTEGLALSREAGDHYATSRLLSIQEKIAQAQGEQVLASSSVRSNVENSSPTSRKLHPSGYPDQLSAREMEVLRLVAQGLSDKEIAEELVISTRTVNAHLTSIYRKIHVSSRHAASRYARTQHLV